MTDNLRERLCAPFADEEIEWRIGRCGEKDGKIWANALAYVSARAVNNRLDDVLGVGGWKEEYSVMSVPGGAAGIICRLWVKIDDEWIWREDGAQQTDMESFKGGISDAKKRAAASLGIGRYLYKLDETYVDISPTGKRSKDFNNYGKTREGKVFYWATPKLPGWARVSGVEQEHGDRDIAGFKKVVGMVFNSTHDLDVLTDEAKRYKEEAESLGLAGWMLDQFKSQRHLIEQENALDGGTP